jgi:nucleotide-binding universal stress UspA family protein
MLDTILVPVDGSGMSELAVPFAEGLARAAGAKVVLMRAVPSPLLIAPEPGEFSESQAAQALEEIKRRLPDGELHAEAHVVQGDPGDAIVRAAESLQADLIVMATHGRGGLGRAVYGSIADEVVRTTSVPVLLIPPGAKYRMNPPCKVLVPLDGSAFAEAALPPAINLAVALRGRVVLVRATASPTYWVLDDDGGRTPDPASEAAAARRYLETAAVGYARDGVELSGYATDEAPAEAILGAARDYDAGAIAMATHGRSGLLRAALGSVAQEVLSRTTLPVLLVHPSNAAAGPVASTSSQSHSSGK